MNIHQAVATMLAVRSYSDRPIADEIVERILEAARLTGSSRNRQHWDFIAIQDPDSLRRLGELATTGRYIAEASLAVAVVVPEKPVGYIDGARAAQDMMLVAWGEGIGSNWVGNVNKEEVKRLLNVPDELMLLTIIPFGYPEEEIGDDVEKERKPLSEIAHREQYGQPYRRP